MTARWCVPRRAGSRFWIWLQEKASNLIPRRWSLFLASRQFLPVHALICRFHSPSESYDASYDGQMGHTSVTERILSVVQTTNKQHNHLYSLPPRQRRIALHQVHWHSQIYTSSSSHTDSIHQTTYCVSHSWACLVKFTVVLKSTCFLSWFWRGSDQWYHSVPQIPNQHK